MKKQMRQILALVLAAVLLSTISACKPKVKEQRVGDDFYGYLTVTEDWETLIDSSGDTDMVQYTDGEKQVLITCMVYAEINLDDARANLDALFTRMEVSDLKYQTINLDKGAISPVYKISFFHQEVKTNLVIYLFDGSDGLTRYLCVEGTGEMLEQGVNIVETTYSLTR